MSLDLGIILKQVENLSFDELLTVQEQITRQLRAKNPAPTVQTQTNNQPNRRLKIPGAYQPTAEEVEASLAAIFTPEEIAQIGKTDFSKFSFPAGSKSLSEMINEDRN